MQTFIYNTYLHLLPIYTVNDTLYMLQRNVG